MNQYAQSGAGSAMGIATAAMAVETRRAEISEVLDQEEVALSGLGDLLTRLQDRLRPVIRPVPMAGGTDKAAPAPCRCEVATRIEKHTECVYYANRQIQELLDSLAV